MYKNQLQELAQRSCFNLPSYACIREGPDHAPRFKALVNFNGESFESPNFCSTLRQAEHAAAEVALDSLSKKGPSKSLAARVLDETGVYKNLLQETAHRAGLSLPVYTTMRSGPGHTPVFTCVVELAGMTFTGEPAKTKKQAQKNAAMAGWCALKKLPHLGSSSSSSKLESEKHEEQEQVIIARALASIHSSGKSNIGPPNEPLCGRQKTTQADRIRTRNTQLYPKPRYNNWVYSNVIPEAATYQTWHQEHPVLQQGQIFRLSPSQTLNAPQNFPFIQPFQPTQGPYVSVQDPLNSLPWYAEHVPCPPRYFTGYPLAAAQRVSSQVSIQEIPDKKNIQEREVLGNSDSDSTGEYSKKNHNATSSGTNNTQVEGSDNHLSADNSIALGVQKEKDKEVSEKSSSNEIATDPEVNLCNVGNPNTPKFRISDSKNDQAVRQGGGSTFQGFKSAQSAQNRSNPPSIDRVNHTPISPVPYQSFPHPPTTTKSKTPAPHSQPVPRFDVYRPRSHLTAAPVTIRTAIPVCSSRPVATKSNASVPVFHAGTPAARGSMVSTDHTTPVKRNPQLESSSKAGSEFSKLHI